MHFITIFLLPAASVAAAVVGFQSSTTTADSTDNGTAISAGSLEERALLARAKLVQFKGAYW
jgi:hypothetical protein